MLTLKRAVRIQEDAALPSGEVLHVNCNVEAQLTDILSAYADAVAITDRWKETHDESLKDDVYHAFAEFLKVIVGATNWEKLSAEFDADEAEICDAMREWFVNTINPAISEASKRALERRKRDK